jgi:hypothetical protein
MSDKSSAASGGIGFGGLLTILFIALKLTHVINWSWWWVLSPIWISPLLVIAFVIIAFLVMIAGAIVVAIFDR